MKLQLLPKVRLLIECGFFSGVLRPQLGAQPRAMPHVPEEDRHLPEDSPGGEDGGPEDVENHPGQLPRQGWYFKLASLVFNMSPF